MQIVSNFQLDGPDKLTGADDPRHALQENGGLADLWYMDDGDIMCHSVLVSSNLHEIDDANAKVGAAQNPQKTEVIYYVGDLVPEWKVYDVRKLATVSTVAAGSTTRGVAVGSRQFIADQLLAKADVFRAVHEGVQVCQDPQAEFIQAMTQDAVTADLLPKQPLVTRLQAPDDEDKATAKLHVQKAPQAADEAWQQTVDGHNGP